MKVLLLHEVSRSRQTEAKPTLRSSLHRGFKLSLHAVAGNKKGKKKWWQLKEVLARAKALPPVGGQVLVYHEDEQGNSGSLAVSAALIQEQASLALLKVNRRGQWKFTLLQEEAVTVVATRIVVLPKAD